MIAVWFSNGAASAAALKLTLDRYGHGSVRAVNNPVAEEDADNLRFQNDVSEWLGIKIERVTNDRYPAASATDVWARRGAMVFPKGAPCTVHLKKEARQQWEAANPVDWHVFGFTADERQRHDRFVLTERENVLPVLIDAGLTKNDCAELIRGAGLDLPRVYAEGYPNANCIGCVKATSPTYWNLVRETRPEIFAERAAQSRKLGARLVRVRGRRIFLDELAADEKGRPLKALKMPECGIHCEERKVK
jgi:hypothetical protein